MIHPAEAFAVYRLFKNQWKSPAEIKRIQEQKLRKLIKHAYEKVPYYRQLLDSVKVKPEDVQYIEDLCKIPLTAKETIRNLPLEQITAKDIDINKCKKSITSGTTSTPLTVFRTWGNSLVDGVAQIRSFFSYGAKLWYKLVEFSGEHDVPARRRFFNHYCIWRKWVISAWESPELWIEKIRNWKPQILKGYVLTLKLLAETIIDEKVDDIFIPIIISSAGILDESTRDIMSRAFRGRIFDFYGSEESGFIAWECPQCSGYHINTDIVILEILKNGRQVAPGEEGEAVITNLNSHAMPFIRYCQGDEVVLSKEKPICGRPYPLIKHIKGRIEDLIVLPSGKKISPHPFHRIMLYTPDIAQFSIVQESIDLLNIEIVLRKDFAKSSCTTIKNEIRKLVGPAMRIDVSMVKKIKADPAFKRRQVTSKISQKR
jgi:phenylacetate-CoA ligase